MMLRKKINQQARSCGTQNNFVLVECSCLVACQNSTCVRRYMCVTEIANIDDTGLALVGTSSVRRHLPLG